MPFDDYLNTVSESTLLEEPTLLPLRKELLEHVRGYYQQLRGSTTTTHRCELIWRSATFASA